MINEKSPAKAMGKETIDCAFVHLLKKSEQIVEIPKQTFVDFVKESMKCALDFTMTGKSFPFENELLDYSMSEDLEDEDSNITPSENFEQAEVSPMKTIETSALAGKDKSLTPNSSQKQQKLP